MIVSAKLFNALLLSVCVSASAIPVTTSIGQEKPTPTPIQANAKKEQIITKLEQGIPKLLKESGVPGLSIALIRDGEVVWRHGFGVTNSKTNDPVTDSTVFEAASLSKPV